MGAQCEFPVILNIGILHALVAGETGCKQAVGQFIDSRNVDRGAVAKGSATADGGEKFACHRIVNGADQRFALA